MPIEHRHTAAWGLIKFSNFVGWVLVVTIMFSPIGLMLLIQGHPALAAFETEENTRAMLQLLQQEYIRVKSMD